MIGLLSGPGGGMKPCDNITAYQVLVDALAGHFGERLKMVILFGSQSRGEARPDSDHDIFVVIEGLPQDPLARQRAVMAPLLPELLRLPARLSVIAKTPGELLGNLTPLVIDICTDGISLYGQAYFETLPAKVMQALREADLQRRRLAGAWMWMFPILPKKEWSVTWEGYRERG
ncbi:MAG: hypothetical protein DCC55_34145 [Chloroflexi bacterium]|nr:MAG: hypothetical protein DCC55_34145 [Chloroflexota bacterium]